MNIQQSAFSSRSFLKKIYIASMLVTGTYLVLLAVLRPKPVKLLLLATLGVALLAGYFFNQKARAAKGPAHYYIVCCFLVLFLNTMLTGGIGTPGIIWFLLCPLVAFLTLSTGVARTWLGIVMTTLLLFYFFPDVLVLHVSTQMKVWYLVSYLLFFLMVYSMMRIFRREVSKKNIEFAVVNEELKRERAIIQQTQKEILLQSARLKEAEAEARTRSAKLSFYLEQLVEVKSMEELHSGNLNYAMHGIVQFLFKSMNLHGVIIWQVHSEGQVTVLKRGGNTHVVNDQTTITQQDFPYAYDVLQTGAIINGIDPTHYGKPLRFCLFPPDVFAEIHCPYFLDGNFAGFVTCAAKSRTWSAEDIIFLRAISDAVALAFKSHLRSVQQHLLEEKRREIAEVNESLERKVSERTRELNLRNKQLTEFAFTNAHHIRGPICRLLGLKNLLGFVSDPGEIQQIAAHMRASVEELDEITRKTSAKLDDLSQNVNVSDIRP